MKFTCCCERINPLECGFSDGLYYASATDTTGTDHYPAVLTFNVDVYTLKIGHKTAFGFIVGMGNIIARHRLLTTYLTYFGHFPSIKIQIYKLTISFISRNSFISFFNRYKSKGFLIDL